MNLIAVQYYDVHALLVTLTSTCVYATHMFGCYLIPYTCKKVSVLFIISNVD